MNKLLLSLISIIGLSSCASTTSPTPSGPLFPPMTPERVAYGKAQLEQLSTQHKVAKVRFGHGGSPWAYVGQTVNNDKYYVNVESIKKSHGSEFVMIEGVNLPKTTSQTSRAWWKIVSPDNSYTQIQSDFYCLIDAAKHTSIVEYSASNQYISSPRVGAYANSIIPNTTFSSVYNLVCNF